MKWLQTAWQLARDVLLTGTGLALIISQGFSRSPSSTVIVAGLSLTVPAAATHTVAALSGSLATQPGHSPSSPSSPSHGSPPSPSSPEGAGEAS